MRNILFISLVLVMAAGSAAWGAMTGTEVNGAGLYSSNAFNAPLTWSVNHNADNTWTYSYSFTPSGQGRGVALINLEIGGTPTLSGSSTISTGNPSYLDPTLSTKSPAYSQLVTGGTSANPTWTAYSYSNLSYSFLYTTKYSTAYQGPTGTQLDKAITFNPDGTVASAATALSQYGLIDNRVNSFTNANGASTLGQFDAGSATAGTVATTINGLSLFLPCWEAYPGSSKASGSDGGPPSQAGTLTGFNAGWTLTLTTTAAPMWGDFFLDGGDWKSDGKYLEARNSGYDGTAPVFAYVDGSALANNGFVPTPNFTAAPVPIPPALFLFGSGLSGLFFFRRRKVSVS